MNKTTQKLDEILEKMIEEIGDGGMDTSYQGRNKRACELPTEDI